MSALVPSEAVSLLYRRYLKSANQIPNVTIRMLLIQQIRFGFRRYQGVSSAAAQRELIRQAHKDLQVLEDERLSRTLYINKLGLVSCLDWEIRRTEYHFSAKSRGALAAYMIIMTAILVTIVTNAQLSGTAHPEVSKMVGAMAMRLEGETPEEVNALREQQVLWGLERKRNRLNLEDRILSTFHDSPSVGLPSFRNPEARRV